MKNLRDELNQLITKTGIVQTVYCSNEENKKFRQLLKDKQPLPDGVFASEMTDGFHRFVQTDLSDKELADLFLYRQTQYLRSIRDILVFLVVLAAIGLVIALKFALGS